MEASNLTISNMITYKIVKKPILKNTCLLYIILIMLSLSGCNIKQEFSICFWYKPCETQVGDSILEISDDINKYNLYSNLQDEDYYDTGLILSYDSGTIYSDGSTKPEINNYTYIALTYQNGLFTVYSDGKEVSNGEINEGLNSSNILIELNEKNGSFLDYQLLDRCLNNNEIQKKFRENQHLKLENVIFSTEILNDAKGKVSLPLTRLPITYSVNNENAVIENDEYLIFSENDTEENIYVHLIAEYDGTKKNFDFCIKGKNEKNVFDETCQRLDASIGYVISESDSFENTINGYNVIYSVISGNAEYINNRFIKNETASSKEKITIKATIEDYEIERDVILLDEYYGYLLMSFDGSDAEEDGTNYLTFFVSKDLKDFNRLDMSLESNMGSGRLRDPFINRNSDGSFTILATQGYYNPGVYLIKTNDLINYQIDLVDFSKRNDDINLSGLYSWAPEYIFDGEDYIIYYSDTGLDNSCIYAVKTKDFINYSCPYVLFDASYEIIDANIISISGKYVMFYKDERPDKCTIRYATSDSLNGNWSIESSELNINELLEGPFATKDFRDNSYYLYAEAYMMNRIYYSTNIDINNLSFINFNLESSLSNEKVSHFSIIPITFEEYNNLMEAN